MIQKVLFRLAAAAALCVAGSAAAQNTAQSTVLDRQLSRIDLGISGVGQFSRTVTGTVGPLSTNQGQSITQEASNTLGALVTIRYIARPLVGFEFNYGYARYTENFSGPGIANYFPQAPPFQIQTQANEFTLGYLVTPERTFFGFKPFASAGLGSIEFKPTAHGGEGAPHQARAAYYYSVGVQQDITPNFGLRAGFRQVFFLAPDFGQNYLTIKQHTITSEPQAGFYLRF